ncbi:MAG: aliphatic sulfonate ABC transporter substrate-binding protein [Verrucomicrobia bacterium]|nr:MAG: aliphatic sulfonate ABC transporter substrate-binding protein [Verrucomicrobiota bacterium]
MKTKFGLLLTSAICVLTQVASSEDKVVIRFGHFPNITHAQGVIAHALSRQGKGWFEERLGPNVEIQWFTYNAGPSAMEAIFANSLDLTYVGQGPALNAHFKSNGEEIRVLAGAANAGAALVVKSDSPIKTAADFRGKKIATPQLGNTQDISCRAWLKAQGFKVTQIGGEVTVVPTNNPDQLALLQNGGVDAVWTVEPWVTRLEREAKARVFLEDKEVITTWLVSATKFLSAHRDLVKKIAMANAELTDWMQKNPDEAQHLLIDELKAETRTTFAPDSVAQAWTRITFTTSVPNELIAKAVQDGKAAGFLTGNTDTSKLVETP